MKNNPTEKREHESVKKTRHCQDCGFWKPYRRGGGIYGRCTDLKEKTMMLDYCDEGKEKV